MKSKRFWKKSKEGIVGGEVRGRWRGDENRAWPREAERIVSQQRKERSYREEEYKGIDR